MLIEMGYRRLDETTTKQPVKTDFPTSFLSQATSQSQSRAQSVHRNTQATGSASTPVFDLQKLRESLDGNCRTGPYTPALRLKKGEPHCQWSNTKCVVSKGVRCLKICGYYDKCL